MEDLLGIRYLKIKGKSRPRTHHNAIPYKSSAIDIFAFGIYRKMPFKLTWVS